MSAPTAIQRIPSFVSLAPGEHSIREYYVAAGNLTRFTVGLVLVTFGATALALAIWRGTPWIAAAVFVALAGFVVLRTIPRRHAQVMLTNQRLVYFEYSDHPALNVYTVRDVNLADITSVRAGGRRTWWTRTFSMSVTTARRTGLVIGAEHVVLVPAGDYVAFLQEIGSLVATAQHHSDISSGGSVSAEMVAPPARPPLTPVIAAAIVGVLAVGVAWAHPSLPSGRSGHGSCQGDCALALGDVEVGIRSYRFMMALSRSRSAVMHALVVRAFLLEEAEQQGLDATRDETLERIKRGKLLVAGGELDASQMFERNGEFDLRAFRNALGGMGLDLDDLIEEQMLERRALRARDRLGEAFVPWFRDKCRTALDEQRLHVNAEAVQGLVFEPCAAVSREP
jgi:hypothetical protein